MVNGYCARLNERIIIIKIIELKCLNAAAEKNERANKLITIKLKLCKVYDANKAFQRFPDMLEIGIVWTKWWCYNVSDCFRIKRMNIWFDIDKIKFAHFVSICLCRFSMLLLLTLRAINVFVCFSLAAAHTHTQTEWRLNTLQQLRCVFAIDSIGLTI